MAKARKPRWNATYAVPVQHPTRPYPRPRKALADRPGFPWHDRTAALKIVAASQREALAHWQGDGSLAPGIRPEPPV